MSYDPLRQETMMRASYGSDVDAGLQAFMRSVYNTMGIGLGITGLTAWAVAATPAVAHALFGTGLVYVVIFAPLAFLMFGFTPGRIMNMSATKATTLFAVFSGLMGLSMGGIFLHFSTESIARAFFITAGMFAGMSLYGYTTKRDLTKMGSFMFMGLMGVFFACLINLFFHSAAIQFAVSIMGVLVFTGLTAWDTQSLKESYRYNGGEANARLAVTGALGLYLNFVNLFQLMLSLMNDRR